MTAWDVLDKIIISFPPVVMALILAAVLSAVVVFIIGFGRHGLNFLKYGFKQTVLDASLEKRFDDLGARIDGLCAEVKADINGLRAEVRAEIDGLRTELKTEIDGLRTELKTEIDGLRTEVSTDIVGLRTELATIKVNHFGHLKNFLTELTSILLDKGIINNENKARLDNQLRGMG